MSKNLQIYRKTAEGARDHMLLKDERIVQINNLPTYQSPESKKHKKTDRQTDRLKKERKRKKKENLPI